MHDDFEDMHGFSTDSEEFGTVIGRSEEETDQHFDARVITAITTSNRMQQLILGDQMLKMMVDVAAISLEVNRDDVLTDTLKTMLWLTNMTEDELHRRAAESKAKREGEDSNVTRLPGQYL